MDVLRVWKRMNTQERSGRKKMKNAIPGTSQLTEVGGKRWNANAQYPKSRKAPVCDYVTLYSTMPCHKTIKEQLG